MGCYGLGLTRILAAHIESFLASESESEKSDLSDFVWPCQLAPYKLQIVLPKEGSKEEESAENILAKLAAEEDFSLWQDVIIEDRSHLTIGKRLKHSRFLGSPYVVVLGSSLNNEHPQVEFIDRIKGQSFNLDFDNVLLQLRLHLLDWLFGN